MTDYCCANDWVPFCDTCGDAGWSGEQECADCESGAKPNHDCERWRHRS